MAGRGSCTSRGRIVASANKGQCTGSKTRLVQAKQSTGTRAVQCQLCSRFGHTAPHCPTLQQSPSNGPRRKQRRDRRQIQCYNCSYWGHYARECLSGNEGGPIPPTSRQN